MSSEERLIMGRNPVMEALKSGVNVDKVLISENAEGSVRKIAAIAIDRKIRVDYVKRSVLDRIARDAPGADDDGSAEKNGKPRHQGVVAYTSPFTYCEPEDILDIASEKGEHPFIVILDGIEDPHNLGAIIRTAECCGAHGVIIPARHAATVNATAARSAAGAEQYIKVARVTNTGRAIDTLKANNVWVAACDMDGDACYDTDLSGGIALVIGSEGKGIGRLVKEKCDFTVSIPMRGNIDSLNASNAAAVLMYEVLRQRQADRGSMC